MFLRSILYAAAFTAGLVTMALEMLIGRTMTPYFGGTIYTWGALISTFLAGMTAGYLLGGRVADKRPSFLWVGVLFLAGSVFTLALPLMGEPMINAVLDRVDDVRYAALLASLLLAFLPAAFMAGVSPYCMRLLLDAATHSGSMSGRLSGLATGGSIIGALGASFFLIPLMGVRSIYILLAAVSGLLGVVFVAVAVVRRPGASSAARPAAALACAVLAAWFLAPQDAAAQAPAGALARPDGLLEKVDSEYNTILVMKRGSVISLDFGYRANQYTESEIDWRQPKALIVDYTRNMTAALAWHEAPVRKIALVGLGGGRTISYLVDSLPDATADVAELDPQVIRLARQYFGVIPTPRLRINNADGRIFLRRTPDKYDLVLLDAYRGPFVPFHLTTKEFYQLVKSKLAPGGVVAQNVEPTTLFFSSTYMTMAAVFDNVDAMDAAGNVVLIGYSGPKLSDAELAKRAGIVQARDKLRYDLPALVKSRRTFAMQGGAKVLTDDFAPVEMMKTVRRYNEKMK
jgi:spermidine synthase